MVITIGVDVAFGASGPQDKCDQKADDFVNGWTAGGMTQGYQFLGCVLRVGAEGGGTVIYEAPRVLAGAGAPNALPNNCALLIKKNTEQAGRRGRGRMYMPAFVLGEASIDQSGIIDAGARNSIQTLINNTFLGDDFVLLHDSEPSPMAPTVITGFTLDRQIATQRRRMRG
jgi:hypothetical protein